jgi:CxxC motif-containing protein (DUF1111 family)
MRLSRGFTLLGLVCLCAPANAQDDPNPLAQGRDLFTRDWKAEGPVLPASDGLGPMHNATSCKECHQQKGLGGSGPNKNNVDMVSLVPPRSKRAAAELDKLQQNAVKLHPGFAASASFTLHAFHAGRVDYLDWRHKLVEKVASPQMAVGRPVPGLGLVSVARIERNTPALFGAGIIDQIPDLVLTEAATQQRLLRSEITGRVGRDASGNIGRFGWRGQTARLRDFVMGACANELGLQVPGHDQPRDPFQSNTEARHLDLNERLCDVLTGFVASLPVPVQIRTADEAAARSIREGRKLFHDVGCAACHTPSLGNIDEIFSDLLLHDMGAELADPVAANPEIRVDRRDMTYYGRSIFRMSRFRLDTNIDREWRTPPLWGVADSGPYLHDGRAATLDQAIRLHGGEGELTTKRYLTLPAADREKLIAFLNSLVAPPEEAQVAAR